MCRDCADFGPICPHDNQPCDPGKPRRCHATHCPNPPAPGLDMCREHLAMFSQGVREKLLRR